MSSPLVSPRSVGLATLLIAVIAAIVLPLIQRDHSGSLASLVAIANASGGDRAIEARLAGGFRHAPMRAGQSGPRRLAGENPKLLAAAAAAQREALSDPTPSHLHDWGLSQLLLGDYDGAVSSLHAAAEARGNDARFYSDLAAAYLARAQALDRLEDLPLALDAAEHAKSLGVGPEIRYNRALALEALYLDQPALKEWDAFLSTDANSDWADEARRRMHVIRERPLAMHWEEGQPISKQTAFRAREWLMMKALPAWADARLSNAPTEDWNNRIQHTIEQLAPMSNDAILRAIGYEILTFQGERAVALARGYSSFAASMDASQNSRMSDFIRSIPESCAAFRQASSQFAPACDVEAANASSLARRIDEAANDLARVMPILEKRGFVNAEGRAWWLQARLMTFRGQLSPARESFRKARTIFEGCNEWASAARMWSQESEMAYASGRYDDYWPLREHALALASPLDDTSVSFSILTSIASLLVSEGKFRPATVIADAALSANKGALPPPMQLPVLQVLIQSTVQSGDLGRAAAARKDFDALIASSNDPRLAALQLDVQFAEASMLTARKQFAEAEALLTNVILKAGPERDFSTRLWALLDRAELRSQQGRRGDAGEDVNALIKLLTAKADPRAGSLRMADMGRVRRAAARLALDEDAPGWSQLVMVDRARAAVLGAEQLPDRAADFLNTIPDDSAILMFADDGDRLGCWVLRSSGLFFERLPVSTANVRRMAAAAAVLAEASSINSPGWHQQLTSLHEALIAPIADRLPGINRLLILPDGVTRAVPFSALQSQSNEPLGVQFSISRLTALAQSSSSLASRPTTGAVVVVGDPEAAAESLPGARKEAAAIADLYKASRTTVLLEGPNATGRRFQEAIEGAATIHFAGHAVSDASSPRRSFLQLAPDETNPDGRWRLGDFKPGQFSSNQIVVLAACRTASGTDDEQESVPTLAEAMLRAGAGTVIASLWPLEDATSEPVFVELHTLLASGTPPDEALTIIARRARSDQSNVSRWQGIEIFTNSANQGR